MSDERLVKVDRKTLEKLADLAYSEHFEDFDSLEGELKAALIKIRHILNKHGIQPTKDCACEECGARAGNHFKDCSKREQ